jgi:thymidine kinase
MFIEPHFHSNPATFRKKGGGWIEVVCGSMFSGKTEELIRRLNRARIARYNVEIFKPSFDKRYHKENIVSHNQNAISSIPVSGTHEIIELSANCDIVGIDEAQFFDESIVDVCTELANKGIRVIVAGLDMDFRGMPFGPMPQLMAIAEYVTKVHAICVKCGGVASHSHRLNTAQEQMLIGETDLYEALCRACFIEVQNLPPVASFINKQAVE